MSSIGHQLMVGLGRLGVGLLFTLVVIGTSRTEEGQPSKEDMSSCSLPKDLGPHDLGMLITPLWHRLEISGQFSGAN